MERSVEIWEAEDWAERRAGLVWFGLVWFGLVWFCCLAGWFGLVLVFQDRVSLCSFACPGTHSVDQTGLNLIDLLASAS